jgi:hypothetical protein
MHDPSIPIRLARMVNQIAKLRPTQPKHVAPIRLARMANKIDRLGPTQPKHRDPILVRMVNQIAGLGPGQPELSDPIRLVRMVNQILRLRRRTVGSSPTISFTDETRLVGLHHRDELDGVGGRRVWNRVKTSPRWAGAC